MGGLPVLYVVLLLFVGASSLGAVGEFLEGKEHSKHMVY